MYALAVISLLDLFYFNFLSPVFVTLGLGWLYSKFSIGLGLKSH